MGYDWRVLLGHLASNRMWAVVVLGHLASNKMWAMIDGLYLDTLPRTECGL